MFLSIYQSEDQHFASHFAVVSTLPKWLKPKFMNQIC